LPQSRVFCVCHSWTPPGYEASILIIPVAVEFQAKIEDRGSRIENRDRRSRMENRGSRIAGETRIENRRWRIEDRGWQGDTDRESGMED
jgi:hypothetical protein